MLLKPASRYRLSAKLRAIDQIWGKGSVRMRDLSSPKVTSSQDCPSCGKRVKKSLSTRTHVYSCGYTEDRDIAASLNILKKGLCTVGHTGTYASSEKGFPPQETGVYATGDLPSWSVGVNLLANGESVNVESPTKMRRGNAAS